MYIIYYIDLWTIIRSPQSYQKVVAICKLYRVTLWNGQMNINWGTTKEMLVSMNSPNLLSDALCVDDNPNERVYSYELLLAM